MTSDKIIGLNIVSGLANDFFSDLKQVIHGARRDCKTLACLNPHSYVLAGEDVVFRKALDSKQWLVADGVGIFFATKLLGIPLANRITGFDVFSYVMAELNEIGGSVFFLGSSPATLTKISDRLSEEYPNVKLAGTYSPPFKSSFTSADNKSMMRSIITSEADVLWVGMTAPKQEKWLAEHQQQLPVKFAGAIGAVFDYFAESNTHAHPLLRKLGLEWLVRLIQNPRKLWRRTFVSAPIFLFSVIKLALLQLLGQR